ncbi:GNAT family N-acetyltransferase [Dyadobacter jiangsuensis]|uniref:Acetyltransferase (GNAT) family protein n=1 Tax=Dyadobacter jiangsuensis TaxID=1591085 RepID=A0A2P8GBD7_9BACT|nr:GNAT family N-acetyltransferase [Dyadobacter jiangsuensis]PSL31273.1 acetyltransferase (GNAT) family protein [Dyadobacter jiangsuensis]
MNEPIELIIANSEAHFEDGKKLFREYAASLPIDLAFQRFEEELDTVREQYGPPSGGLVLAYAGERAVGCAGVRSKGARIAELKRMYVQPEFRGHRLGRLLLERSIAIATDLGYQKLRLDTLASMTGARKLYESFGFEIIPAYYDNPHEDAIYMEKTL